MGRSTQVRSYPDTCADSSNVTGWSIHNAPAYHDAIVLSHSCEIDRANTVKVTSIILAPIRDINSATDREKVEELRTTNLILRESPEASFLKYFYLAPNPDLEYSQGAVADFSKCFSLRKQAYDLLLKRKIVQMTEEARTNLALKLALYFYRAKGKGA